MDIKSALKTAQAISKAWRLNPKSPLANKAAVDYEALVLHEGSIMVELPLDPGQYTGELTLIDLEYSAKTGAAQAKVDPNLRPSDYLTAHGMACRKLETEKHHPMGVNFGQLSYVLSARHNCPTKPTLRQASIRRLVKDGSLAVVATDGFRLHVAADRHNVIKRELGDAEEIARLPYDVCQTIKILKSGIASLKTYDDDICVLDMDNGARISYRVYSKSPYPRIDKVIPGWSEYKSISLPCKDMQKALQYLKALEDDYNKNCRMRLDETGIRLSFTLPEDPTSKRGERTLAARILQGKPLDEPVDLAFCRSFLADIIPSDGTAFLRWRDEIGQSIVETKDYSNGWYTFGLIMPVRFSGEPMDWDGLSYGMELVPEDRPTKRSRAKKADSVSPAPEPTRPAKKTENDLRNALHAVDESASVEDMLAQLTILYMTVRDYLSE